MTLENPNKASQLEDSFAKYVDSKYAISTNNGTSAMHLAMRALDLKRGDKIICSVNSFPSIAEVVRHFDAEPVFVDIDTEDFNMDLDKLEEILEKNRSKKLKGVYITHVAGQPCELDRLYALAKLYSIKVIDGCLKCNGCYI